MRGSLRYLIVVWIVSAQRLNPGHPTMATNCSALRWKLGGAMPMRNAVMVL